MFILIQIYFHVFYLICGRPIGYGSYKPAGVLVGRAGPRPSLTIGVSEGSALVVGAFGGEGLP